MCEVVDKLPVRSPEAIKKWLSPRSNFVELSVCKFTTVVNLLSQVLQTIASASGAKPRRIVFSVIVRVSKNSRR